MSAEDYTLLTELTYNTDVGVADTLRVANREYQTWPTDTPASTEYKNLIVDGGFFTRRLFADGASGINANPRSEVTFGEMLLNNESGDLDNLFNGSSAGFRERQIIQRRVRNGRPLSEAAVVFRGAISQTPFPTRSVVAVYIKDRSYELNSPHQTTVYAGNNALPAGVEGSADMAGKTKPVMYGKVLQYAPKCVNTSKLIYQVSTRAIQSLIAYDGGVQYTAGADYTSQADMEANAPAAGQIRVWPAGGMLRCQARPSKILTCDVTADTAGNSTAAQIIEQMALDRGISAGDISSSDITAMDALNNSVCGVVIEDNGTTLKYMDMIAVSIGMSYYFSQTGVLRMSRFDVPSGTAAFILAQYNGVKLTQIPTGEDVPTLDVRLRYARYWQPLRGGDLNTSVTDAQASDYGEEYRSVQYTNTISPNPYKRTQTAVRDTLLTTSAAATTEATRLFGITSGTRRTHLLENVYLDPTALANLDLNAVPELRWDRYGFDPVNGTLRRVIAFTHRPALMTNDIRLWGA